MHSTVIKIIPKGNQLQCSSDICILRTSNLQILVCDEFFRIKTNISVAFKYLILQVCKHIRDDGWTRVFDNQRGAVYAYGQGYWVTYEDQDTVLMKVTCIQ